MLDPQRCEMLNHSNSAKEDWCALENQSQKIHPAFEKNNPDMLKGIDLSTSALERDELFLPQTRYYGSKRRLTKWMLDEFKNHNFKTAVDIFGGTSTVSIALKHLNKKVTYNDILESNRIIATALLSNEPCVTTEQDLDLFVSSIQPEAGFISKTYKDIYYTDVENKWLDGAVRALSGIENPIKKSEISYCLMQACLQKRPFNLFHRKNLYLRENNNKDTKFGNWATWEKPFSILMIRALNEIKKTRWVSEHSPIIMPCTDAIEIPSVYDFVYLDPPYVPEKKQDISYMDRYHFLEGLCSPQYWDQRIDRSKKMTQNFEELIDNLQLPMEYITTQCLPNNFGRELEID